MTIVTERDRERLNAAISKLRQTGDAPIELVDRLAMKLAQAATVEPHDVPRAVDTMNSLVGLRDLVVDEKFSCTLVYPQEADVVKRRVSVVIPLGIGLLGSCVGQTIECQGPSGVRTLRIERVFYQSESARDFHL